MCHRRSDKTIIELSTRMLVPWQSCAIVFVLTTVAVTITLPTNIQRTVIPASQLISNQSDKRSKGRERVFTIVVCSNTTDKGCETGTISRFCRRCERNSYMRSVPPNNVFDKTTVVVEWLLVDIAYTINGF